MAPRVMSHASPPLSVWARAALLLVLSAACGGCAFIYFVIVPSTYAIDRPDTVVRIFNGTAREIRVRIVVPAESVVVEGKTLPLAADAEVGLARPNSVDDTWEKLYEREPRLHQEEGGSWRRNDPILVEELLMAPGAGGTVRRAAPEAEVVVLPPPEGDALHGLEMRINAEKLPRDFRVEVCSTDENGAPLRLTYDPERLEACSLRTTGEKIRTLNAEQRRPRWKFTRYTLFPFMHPPLSDTRMLGYDLAELWTREKLKECEEFSVGALPSVRIGESDKRTGFPRPEALQEALEEARSARPE